MKYSAAILVALFGLAAASILHQQGDASGRFTNKQSIFGKYGYNNNNNNRNINYDNNNNGNNQFVNQVIAQKQKTVLQLLTNLQHKNIYQNLVQLGNNFNPVQNINNFHNQVAVKKFLNDYENNNFLPQNEVFSPTNQQHQNQAAQLFTFLYSAQDWTTLKQAAAWARDRFNTEQFAYVFTAVVLNHPTTQGVTIPALYEIFPHAFVPATTVHKLYKAKVQGIQQVTVTSKYANQNRNNINYNNDINNNNINNNNNNNNNKGDNNNNGNNVGSHNPNQVFADNDGSINNNAGTTENPEIRMSYFTEDVGVNDLHAKFHLQFPAFLGVNNNKNYYTSNVNNVNNNNNVNTVNTNQLDVKRGEAFYFAHQQLYARYVLERLSNNLPIPHPINLNDKIQTGFNPNLQHINGQAIPVRPPNTQFQQQQVEISTNNNNAVQPNNNQAQHPVVLEQRIQQAAESGFVLNQDGTKTKLTQHNGIGVLANLIAAPASSVNPDYYGDYFSTAKNAIGNIVDPNNQNGVAPGAVANIVTAARDPAYYQLLAKINQIFNNLKNKLGPYTQQELSFSGVKIQNIDISNLVTYLETVKINVNNIVPNTVNNVDINGMNNNQNNNNMNDNTNYNVKIQRLTNKPFTYKMNVHSNKNTNAIVRIFIGPKHDSNGQLFTLPQASQYFVQLDQFKVQLHNGQNVIQRNSEQSNVNVHDAPSFQKLWNHVQNTLQGQQSVTVNQGNNQVLGLPIRAQIPKGKVNGQQFVLYAIINSVNNNNNNNNEDINNQEMTNSSEELINNSMLTNENLNINNNSNDNDNLDELIGVNSHINKNVRDQRTIAFPFDRPVHDSNFNTANQYFKTVTIYHQLNNNNNNNNNNGYHN